MKTKNSSLDKLVNPSWLSGLIAITAGLFVTISVIAVFSFNNSQVQQQINSWETHISQNLTLPGQNPPGTTTNSLQNTWPLLGFWAVTGLVIYFIVEAIARSLHDLEFFKAELNYVHAPRDQLLRGIVEMIALRLISAAILIVFIQTFFKRIVPYAITAGHAAASNLLNLTNILYAVLSFCVIVLSLHFATILLRLTAGRPRLFSLH
jgi:hypothetical protein